MHSDGISRTWQWVLPHKATLHLRRRQRLPQWKRRDGSGCELWLEGWLTPSRVNDVISTLHAMPREGNQREVCTHVIKCRYRGAMLIQV